MGCKRSLYCWKYGPCASDQTRKQIWEDNIRFRESLRNMNQSDHYWSFQVSNRNCQCSEEDFLQKRSALNRKFQAGSLQRLDAIDCSSVTHDLNPPKINNQQKYTHNQVLCPLHLCFENNQASRNSETDIYTRKDLSVPFEKKSILKSNISDASKHPLLPYTFNGTLNRANKIKLNEEFPKYCPRYKNTLTVPLKSGMKIKFSSQPSLVSSKKSNLNTKMHFPSSEEIKEPVKDDLQSKKLESSVDLSKNILKPLKNDVNKELSPISDKRSQILNDTKSAPDGSVESKRSKLFIRESYTPISRTTRKMLVPKKKVPFVTFGCNNENQDVGSKRTHNVLAAKDEVFPNALSAKVQRESMIMKFLKTEKEFQKNLLPDNFKKKFVNHSSVWATEYNQKFKETNSDLTFNKNYKQIPPLNDKRLKTQSLGNESKPGSKSIRRPNSQAYFY